MTHKREVYLDYMATTPVDPRVCAIFHEYLGINGCFANAASEHGPGFKAFDAVAYARHQVADVIGADSDEIIWTSGATEANNLAIFGMLQAHPGQSKHIITCATEHKAVLDPLQQARQQGRSLTMLKPQANGLIDLQQLADALSAQPTLLVSIMHVNNETGVIQPIAKISEIVHRHGAYLHVDAAQSVGKLPFSVRVLDVDLLSLSAHKCYGPKGIGALYKRKHPRIPLKSLVYGGGQEQGMRSGTLPVHQIVAMGEAFSLAKQQCAADAQRLRKLRDGLWTGLQELPGVYRNGDAKHCVPHCLNVSIAGVDGQALRVTLRDIALSSGSACNAQALQPSHVLTAMGVAAPLAHAALRFSLGRFTQADDIEYTLSRVRHEVQRLRELAPEVDDVA